MPSQGGSSDDELLHYFLGLGLECIMLHGVLGLMLLLLCKSMLLPQVTKYQLETQKDLEARMKEEEARDRALAAKREVGRDRGGGLMWALWLQLVHVSCSCTDQVPKGNWAARCTCADYRFILVLGPRWMLMHMGGALQWRTQTG
jgi:hypothetical protein